MVIVDTTLRDGAQCEGISCSLEDKLRIAQALDELGVDYIEGGNPGSNPKDRAFFSKMSSEMTLRHAKLVAFGSTIRSGLEACRDESLRELAEAGTSHVTVFGKSSLKHVSTVLQCTPEENLRLVRDSIVFLVQAGKHVWFDAEHFFDGYSADRNYAFRVLQTALDAGAEKVILCDTNGSSLPSEIAGAVSDVAGCLHILPGIHCHNDFGLAAACTLAAVEAGCDLVQGTMGGIGERCGNADLCTVLPILTLKLHKSCLPEGNLVKLTHISRTIDDLLNLSPSVRAPFVGLSAFAHKGGSHMDGVLKDASTFEPVPPESVGNHRRFLISEQAGRTGTYVKLSRILPDLNRSSPEIAQIIRRLKEKESEGYTYENADGSFALLALETAGRRSRFFDVVDFHVICSHTGAESGSNGNSQAYLKVRVDQREGINAAEGNGPVNALDMALRKTLSEFFPCLNHMRLSDFKVRVLDHNDTASLVRVLIDSTDGQHFWSTVGVSENIIEACLIALIDSVDYMLTYYAEDIKRPFCRKEPQPVTP